MNTKEIEKLLGKEEKLCIELTKEEIGSLCAKLYSEIEDCRYILNHYDVLNEDEKELSKKELEEKIKENKVTIEKLTNQHYPIFEWVISD